ncbi:MAG: tRNA (cytidine(34)-2'-O)-methyltransferase [Sphaerochaeta sp.]|jgi:tRNA (cytidine/uridine-2'-O-)-methyltransferase|nr:tRNA (cytidine(34)-2'-O)-methyltransferase [Sphaerochaeta sp.]MCH3919840.1 tRNA (cytidine(34)-2'-O)-methyltransferase [Sphaerochaeta sp.]MCI2076925.1 tRNA (cytidine(34)-2'-O)-methyltransferase [Sphaerochaeta sp.]MCI2096918.1 tRNA (cytidine(34)-2'-O)-methyltransferase [Sphaerochaeta sp.]MCI2103934.1 tRNA (cytidine(34)-2'-O)-methyltransferase [Sphaerochaeta sp.]
MGLNIVLFQPEIPQNTGNIARTCAAVGATLHLVDPLGFSLSDRYLKRAGLDYWPLVGIREWENDEAFFEEHQGDNLFFFTKKAHLCYASLTYPEDVYLIFGRESVGLEDSLLRTWKDRCVRIPMRREARCLNLSNSVAIVTYEYMRQRNFQGLAVQDDTFDWEEQQ